jgi:nucleoside 2-deoxyribosyltransferase
MKLHIIGGTYHEICVDPSWNELYGSGLRAAHALSGYGQIALHTAIGAEDYEGLKCMADAMQIDLHVTKQNETYFFKYDYPLANPQFIQPEMLKIHDPVTCDYVLQFGMIECNNIVYAKKAVYDPQSPSNPQSFWKNNSTTEELIWVTNLQEAQLFTNCIELKDIKEFLFTNEGVNAAVIKNGTDGAILLQKNLDDVVIPAFRTSSVWPIGTGDIFSAVFAFNYLIKRYSLSESALKASLTTAYYAEKTSLPLIENIVMSNYKPISLKERASKRVYLAGPFFSMSQRWIIEKLREQLIKFKLEVFSPFHDVGLGTPEIVVPLDIAAIKKSDIVVALLDGLDPGTLFEIGYARALNVPVIALVENEKEESLTMLRGTGCQLEEDFSTLVYKVIWELYK